MKTTKWIIVMPIAVMSFFSCSKDEKSTPATSNIEQTPDAKAAYDNSSAGVYKGVLVGSSGYFKISIDNGTDTVSCKVVFDGNTAYCTTTDLNNWQPGQPISNARFSGTLNGQTITLVLSCDAYGSNVTVYVTYPNHTIDAVVVKETSTTLVKCYEGTYTDAAKTGTGVFNLSVYGSNVYGFQKDPHGSGSFTGTVSGNKLTIEGQSLNIDDNSVGGSVLTGDGTQLFITGKRVL